MPTVTWDTVDGASATQHIIDGQSVERRAVVSDIELPSGDLSMDTGTLLQAAISAVSAVAPLGSTCPNISWPNFLQSYTPEAVSTNVAVVKLKYRGFQSIQWEMDATLCPQDSNTDYQGNVIYVSYNYPKDWVDIHKELMFGSVVQINDSSGAMAPYHDNGDGTVTITQSGIIQKLLPEETVTYKGTLPGPPSFVNNFIRSVLGIVNASAWSPFGGAGDAARTWLCERVVAKSNDGGVTFEVSNTYHYRSQTWDQLVVFVDPVTNKPPPDITPGTGYKFIQILTPGTLTL